MKRNLSCTKNRAPQALEAAAHEGQPGYTESTRDTQDTPILAQGDLAQPAAACTSSGLLAS
eukprot:8116999-Pyramimonas_sp.AAC.1